MLAWPKASPSGSKSGAAVVAYEYFSITRLMHNAIAVIRVQIGAVGLFFGGWQFARASRVRMRTTVVIRYVICNFAA